MSYSSSTSGSDHTPLLEQLWSTHESDAIEKHSIPSGKQIRDTLLSMRGIGEEKLAAWGIPPEIGIPLAALLDAVENVMKKRLEAAARDNELSSTENSRLIRNMTQQNEVLNKAMKEGMDQLSKQIFKARHRKKVGFWVTVAVAVAGVALAAATGGAGLVAFAVVMGATSIIVQEMDLFGPEGPIYKAAYDSKKKKEENKLKKEREEGKNNYTDGEIAAKADIAAQGYARMVCGWCGVAYAVLMTVASAGAAGATGASRLVITAAAIGGAAGGLMSGNVYGNLFSYYSGAYDSNADAETRSERQKKADKDAEIATWTTLAVALLVALVCIFVAIKSAIDASRSAKAAAEAGQAASEGGQAGASGAKAGGAAAEGAGAAIEMQEVARSSRNAADTASEVSDTARRLSDVASDSADSAAAARRASEATQARDAARTAESVELKTIKESSDSMSVIQEALMKGGMTADRAMLWSANFAAFAMSAQAIAQASLTGTNMESEKATAKSMEVGAELKRDSVTLRAFIHAMNHYSDEVIENIGKMNEGVAKIVKMAAITLDNQIAAANQATRSSV